MFKMYDLNMKEIPFPDGLMPLDIFVSSIGKNRTTEEIEGRNGVVDYGTNYVDRSVELSMWINSSDTTDYRLLRNELYALFDTGNAFYIEETRVPSRVLKVAVDESFIPDRLTIRNASVDVTCRTLDSVFWESKYTTLELHDSGYDAAAEKYGLVDNIDDEKVQYRFTPQTDYMPNLIPLIQAGWEVGSISSTTGGNTSLEGALRTKNYIPVTKGVRYYFNDSSTYTSAIRTINILQYQDGVYLGSAGWHAVGRGGALLFVPRGNQIKLSLAPLDGFGIATRFLDDKRILMKLELGERFTGYEPSAQTFIVYNAGNVTVEPESMDIAFNFNGVYSTGGFTIHNRTTGDKVILNRESNGSHFKMDGMVLSLGAIPNVFRDTNRTFISLAPGDNQIEVTGGTFSACWFNFKFYYK